MVMRLQEIRNYPQVHRRLSLISVRTALECESYGNDPQMMKWISVAKSLVKNGSRVPC